MIHTPEQTLKRYWGYDRFRPPQQDVIDVVLKKRDALALMPTGGGKSLCFQVPTLLMDGLCLVITPLIALMNDQVARLRQKGIAAVALHSGLSRQEIDVALDNCVYGRVKFLYLSPERIQTEMFRARVSKMSVCLVAVDEAHCISEWGHDFRPSYRQLSALRELGVQAPWIALTATATPAVQKDIVLQLGLCEPALFQKSFARDNLSLVARHVARKEPELIDILRTVGGSAIVYLRSRKGTEQMAKLLQKSGLSADFYHAGMAYAEREKRQKKWVEGKTHIIVATNAFGMGIDKESVRAVVHVGLPESPEAYYQEAGRAGRDGRRAYAVALYDQQDIATLRDRALREHPPIKTIKNTYQALANYYGLAVGSGKGESFDFDLYDFCDRFAQSPSAATNSIKALILNGLISLEEGLHTPSKAHLCVDAKTLYHTRVARPEHDAILSAALRLYGGELYSEFVAIDEPRLARLLEWSLTDTKKALRRLHLQRLISYRPASDRPAITFLTARQEMRDLRIDTALMAARRERSIKRSESLIHYVTQARQCRMQVLQSYFGEQTWDVCGLCDVCIERKKRRSAGDTDPTDYRGRIRALLGETPMTAKALERHFPPADRKAFVVILRQMLDNAEVQYDDTWTLSLC